MSFTTGLTAVQQMSERFLIRIIGIFEDTKLSRIFEDTKLSLVFPVLLYLYTEVLKLTFWPS